MKKLLTALLTALCITCAADPLPTFEVGQLVIQTVDDCAILSLQVRESFDAGETWTNSGNPVLFGRNLNSNGWFKVVASEADMSNPVYEFDFRTTSSDAVPVELLGSAYWYDSGTTYNSAAVEYDTSETYARWTSTTKGIIFSAIGDVGNESVENYFKLQDYPDTITVSGTGTSMDTELPFVEFIDGKPKYTPAESDQVVVWDADLGGKWVAAQTLVDLWESTEDTYLPPKDSADWSVGIISGSPAPTLDYTLPTTQYIGVGTFSGTLTLSETTISCAWYRAETTCFDSLVAFLNCTEGTDAFRGRLHINEDGVYKDSDVWEMGSGGTASGYEISSTYGDNGAWCDSYTNAELHGVFNTRKTAMCFAGSVMAWLKSTDNMNKVDNVTWCHLGELPESPTEYIAQSTRRWEIRIPLEILFLTESTHA